MTNANNEQMYKYEAECLRNLVRQCGELLFKYGWKFEAEDKDKAIELVSLIKNREDFDKVYNITNDRE